MASIDLSEFKLAANFNNAAGFFTIFEYLPAGADEPMAAMQAFKNFVPGLAQPRLGNVPDYVKGFKKTAWDFPGGMWAEHDYWLNNTFCGGTRSGLVTVRTLTNHYSTFANWNALMRLPDRDSLSMTNDSFDTYTIFFSLRGTAS